MACQIKFYQTLGSSSIFCESKIKCSLYKPIRIAKNVGLMINKRN